MEEEVLAFNTSLAHWFPKSGLWTTSINIMWKLGKNANSCANSQTY